MLKLSNYLKTDSMKIILVLILVFFQSLTELYLPKLMAAIVDIGIVNRDIGFILKVGRQMLLVAAFGSAALFASSYLSSRISNRLGRILRSQVFAKVESFSLHEFDQIGTASLITRTTNDISQVQQVFLVMLRMIVRAPMLIIGGIIMAVSTDVHLSLLIMIAVPFITFSIYFVIQRGLPLYKVLQVKLDNLNRVFREGLTGIRVIRAFNNVDYERRRFNTANYDLTSTTIKVNKLMAVLSPVLSLVLNFTIIAIIWFGSIRINQGNMQVGDLMAFIQYVMQIMSSLIMLSMVFVMIPRASASAARINEVLEKQSDISDPVDIDSTISISNGLLKFNNVNFSYPNTDQPALRNISFTAYPGQVTAIIGSTGSGKTTLLNLIPRFYDVDSGNITIDGVDIRDITQKDLRSKIGLVPQNTILFTGTITDNISYGKEDASLQDIYEAAENSQIADFIKNLDQGFNSIITKGGTNISGGQKQRISIARALIKKPLIYLLDDCFSALDYKTDALLRHSLKKVTENSTVIIVAQRISTIINADQIIVLDEGQIVGKGKHSELLVNCRIYQELAESQLPGGESA